MALLALRNYSNGRRPLQDTTPSFALRLLIASHCQNLTSQGLAENLSHFPRLAFLDLSNTLAARDRSVLSRLRDLPLLQVLKLRHVHLRDEDIEVIAEAIGIHVRSLDVRGNHLTDRCVRTLLEACFQAVEHFNGLPNGISHSSSNPVMEDWPAGLIRPDSMLLDEFKESSYDERFVRRLTSGIVSRLPYEDLPNSGITHLYIADNNLTVEGVAALVSSKKLYVLDIGTVKTGSIVSGLRSETSPSLTDFDARHIRFPGVETITPILAKCAYEMTSLRLHHAIITEKIPLKDENPAIATCELGDDTARQEMEGLTPAELDAEIIEMDATPPLYELPLEEPRPRYELAGDSAHFILTPPIGEKPTLSSEETYPGPRRGSAFAPEVVEPEEPDFDTPSVLTATGLGVMAQAMNGICVTESSKATGSSAKSLETSRGTREMQLALIEQQRRKLRSTRLYKSHCLIPGMLPKLRTITLTDVPCYAKSRHVVDALVQFIKDCASEAELASLQALMRPSSVRKPGERKSEHDRHTAYRIFALRHIVLEMAPDELSSFTNNTSTSKYVRRTKSSTEDADSEAFWSAAENDFTFFDNDEECGLPSIDTSSFVPQSMLSEKMLMPVSPVDKLPTLQRGSPKEPPIDVVQELVKFRKERKAAYENAVGKGMQYVAGYWPGEVKVVRGHQYGGETDFYGNHFSAKGGVYR
ncbi:hypothetical protein N7G274_007796 [Stereocaulon virgatum]|uniref:Uncharacterized protein n=1 Tax=Stereocaulon virgatum TaxID=373712 RepID=A0ABR4A0P5_9LECA